MPDPAGQEKREPVGPAAPLGRHRSDRDGAGAPGPLRGHDPALPTPGGRVFLPPVAGGVAPAYLKVVQTCTTVR